MKKQTKTIVRTVVLIVIALIVGINLYMLNASRVAGNAMPMPFGVGATVVLSGSMENTLSIGDLLIVSEQENYSVDDVVVYQTGTTAVVHRIIEMDGESVVTKGDANDTEDAPITLDCIKGKVVFAIPFVGYLVNLIKTPLGTVIILGLAIFLLERSFRKEKKKDDEELEKVKAEIRSLIKAQTPSDPEKTEQTEASYTPETNNSENE